MAAAMEVSGKRALPPEFRAYQNPAFSAALTAKSLQPSKTTLLFMSSTFIASATALLAITFGKMTLAELKFLDVSQKTIGLLALTSQIAVSIVFVGSLFALLRAFSWRKVGSIDSPQLLSSPSDRKKEQSHLTKRQVELLGEKINLTHTAEVEAKNSKPTKQVGSSPSRILVPVHMPTARLAYCSKTEGEKGNSEGAKLAPYTPSSGRSLPSPYFSPGTLNSTASKAISHSSMIMDEQLPTPSIKQRSAGTREISNEAMLEKFLAEVDDKLTENAAKSARPIQNIMTPTATISGVGKGSHSSPLSNTASGASRSTPLRPVRATPASQKHSTPPKKGEGDPTPMSVEKSIEAYSQLGVYPHIEHWRDRLRQWFSAVLLKPLVETIETSHIQVMQSAAKLGISISVSKVGSVLPNDGIPASSSSVDSSKDLLSTFMLDEDGILHQLRAKLILARDGPIAAYPVMGLQQQVPINPIIQECIDAITEHLKLHALMKGEWVKGLLPQSSVRADYTVQRIQELAEGTCVRSYEYLGTSEVYDKVKNKWNPELPTDSHLLLYLFCAFLEHPKWMLHVDPTSYASAQSSKNPLYLGILPPKESFPEKYLAVLLSIPSVLHPGSCVLVAGKQSPPIFYLYWDKKAQFSLLGRTALWDAILLFCHRIKMSYGCVVRGVHLGSSALNILPVLDVELKE